MERVPHLQHDLDGCSRDHRRVGKALRQAMVLHHARLRLWPHATGWLRQEPEGGGRRICGRYATHQQYGVLCNIDQGQGLQAKRAFEQHGRLGTDRLHEAVRAVRHGEGHGAWRRAVRTREHQVGAQGSANRLVGHGMVVGSAQRPGGRVVRRYVPQGEWQSPLRPPLVRLGRGALGSSRRRKGEVDGGAETRRGP